MPTLQRQRFGMAIIKKPYLASCILFKALQILTDLQLCSSWPFLFLLAGGTDPHRLAPHIPPPDKTLHAHPSISPHLSTKAVHSSRLQLTRISGASPASRRCCSLACRASSFCHCCEYWFPSLLGAGGIATLKAEVFCFPDSSLRERERCTLGWWKEGGGEGGEKKKLSWLFCSLAVATNLSNPSKRRRMEEAEEEDLWVDRQVKSSFIGLQGLADLTLAVVCSFM